MKSPSKTTTITKGGGQSAGKEVEMDYSLIATHQTIQNNIFQSFIFINKSPVHSIVLKPRTIKLCLFTTHTPDIHRMYQLVAVRCSHLHKIKKTKKTTITKNNITPEIGSEDIWISSSC